MSIPLEEYLKSGLADDAVITTASSQLNIKVKFSSKYKVAKLLNIDIESARAQVKCLSSNVPGVKHGDEIKVVGKGIYYISEIQPLDNNVTILILTND